MGKLLVAARSWEHRGMAGGGNSESLGKITTDVHRVAYPRHRYPIRGTDGQNKPRRAMGIMEMSSLAPST